MVFLAIYLNWQVYQKQNGAGQLLLSDFDNDGNRDIFVANGYRRDLFDGDILQKQDAYIQANMHKYASSQEMFEKGFKEYINIYDPIKVRNYLFQK